MKNANSNNRYLHFLELSQDLICIAGFDGYFKYVNSAWEKLLGYTKKEFLSKPFLNFIHPDDHQNNDEEVSKLSRENVTLHYENRYICKDDSIKYIQWTASPMLDEKVMYCIGRDITEHKQAEETLKESEDLLNATQQLAKIGGWRWNLENKSMFWSDEIYHIHGIDPNKIGSGSQERIEASTKCYDEKDRQIVLDAFNKCVDEGISYDLEFPFTTVKGNRIWIRTAARAQKKNNKVVSVTGHIMDITEQKTAEQTLKESEIKFKEIIQQINNGIIVFNEQKEIVIWNKGAENIFGLTSNKVINQSVVDFQYQFALPQFKDKKLIEGRINDIVTLKTPEVLHQIIDTEIAINSEKTINLQTMIFPIKFDSFNLFCSLIRDTTEEKQAELALKESETQLKELNATKDKLFSIIAHDLCSPFNTILDLSELLIKNVKECEVANTEKYIEIINLSANNTLQLLNNLLSWAKSQTGQINFNPEYLNLSSVIQEVLKSSNSIAKLKSISLNYIQSDGIEIYADKNMLMTILKNLISNSLKFAHFKGRIDILTLRTQEFIEITISDNGVGMNEATRSKLFKLDTNTSNSGTENENGSGLELVLCKEFVEKHGGEIWVESEEGKGSDFKFRIPLAKS
jgi:PAS domain S-box-containing protein